AWVRCRSRTQHVNLMYGYNRANLTHRLGASNQVTTGAGPPTRAHGWTHVGHIEMSNAVACYETHPEPLAGHKIVGLALIVEEATELLDSAFRVWMDHVSDLVLDQPSLAAHLESRHHYSVLVVGQDIVDLCALAFDQPHVLTKQLHNRLLACVVTGKR